MSLSNKITIVTGSNKEIGFTIVKEFAENNDATVIFFPEIWKKIRLQQIK